MENYQHGQLDWKVVPCFWVICKTKLFKKTDTCCKNSVFFCVNCNRRWSWSGRSAWSQVC